MKKWQIYLTLLSMLGLHKICSRSTGGKKGHVTEKVPETMLVVEAAPEPLPEIEIITQLVPEAGIGVFEIICDSVGIFRFHLKLLTDK